MKPETVILRESIRRALEQGEFEVYYQPIVDIVSNRVIAGEALLRWNHPELGLLYPDSFIPSAEECGMISLLGEYVVRDTCKQIRKWIDSNRPSIRFCVNLSMAQMEDAMFAKKVQQILRDTEVPPECLEFEVTESMAMSDLEGTLSVLSELKECGTSIALDDFGTGYSSLSHLHQFPVDVLKLDGDFVQKSLMTEKGSKLMRAMLLLAHTLDLEVIAEGIETEEQLLLVKLLGGKLVQGYYFSQPVPVKEYMRWCDGYTASHQPALDFHASLQ
jgi:EAL domain-containing protein (putative c-di-GMP-specific phosphodiesterase class I)